MAVVIFKPDPKDKKPKKDYVDLSVAHQKHKKLHNVYKTTSIILGIINIILFSYIVFVG